jgi:hypothetical protein
LAGCLAASGVVVLVSNQMIDISRVAEPLVDALSD